MQGTDRNHLRFNRLPSHWSSTLPRMLCLRHGRMDRTQSLETLLEFGRKTFVSFYLRNKEGVSASLGL